MAITVVTKIDIGGFAHRKIAMLPERLAAKPDGVATEPAILAVASGILASGCTIESISENNQALVKLSTTYIHDVLLRPCG